jgi:FkbM family methyltransferase
LGRVVAGPSRTRTLAIAGQVVRFAVGTRREAERLGSLAADEGRMMRRLLSSVRQADTFFDVGANIGTVTLPVAVSGRAECLAFEPEAGNAARLAENAALNGLVNVTVIEAAMWSAAGTVGLRGRGPVGAGTHKVVDADVAAAASVPATTIDAFGEQGRPPDVLKLDVEGAELEVLRGATATLESGAVRELFVETHPGALARRGGSEDELADLLANLGYTEVWAASRASESHRHFRPTGGLP